MAVQSTTISVVIPARNDAHDLPLAVESVLRQSVPVREIVIAVGPSTDGTDSVAKTLARDHAHVIVVANASGKSL